MKVISIILVCMLTLVGCQFLTYRLVAHAQEVVIEPLPAPDMISFCVASYLLCSIFKDTYSKFNYVSDRELYGKDNRLSFADAVKNNQDFHGDCDDFVYTMRDLLHEQGYTTETYLVRTHVISNLHMVLKVKEGDEYYMVDNRYHMVRTWDIGMTGSMYTFER